MFMHVFARLFVGFNGCIYVAAGMFGLRVFSWPSLRHRRAALCVLTVCAALSMAWVVFYDVRWRRDRVDMSFFLVAPILVLVAIILTCVYVPVKGRPPNVARASAQGAATSTAPSLPGACGSAAGGHVLGAGATAVQAPAVQHAAGAGATGAPPVCAGVAAAPLGLAPEPKSAPLVGPEEPLSPDDPS